MFRIKFSVRGGQGSAVREAAPPLRDRAVVRFWPGARRRVVTQGCGPAPLAPRPDCSENGALGRCPDHHPRQVGDYIRAVDTVFIVRRCPQNLGNCSENRGLRHVRSGSPRATKLLGQRRYPDGHRDLWAPNLAQFNLPSGTPRGMGDCPENGGRASCPPILKADAQGSVDVGSENGRWHLAAASRPEAAGKLWRLARRWQPRSRWPSGHYDPFHAPQVEDSPLDSVRRASWMVLDFVAYNAVGMVRCSTMDRPKPSRPCSFLGWLVNRISCFKPRSRRI